VDFLRVTIYSYLLTKTVLIGVVSIDTFYKCFIDSSWILTLKQISPRGEHPGYKNRTQCCSSGGVQYLPQRERNTRDIKIGHSFSAMGGVQNLTPIDTTPIKTVLVSKYEYIVTRRKIISLSYKIMLCIKLN
jgi:hypothetical protein